MSNETKTETLFLRVKPHQKLMCMVIIRTMITSGLSTVPFGSGSDFYGFADQRKKHKSRYSAVVMSL